MDFPIHLSGQLREHLRALRKTRGLTQATLGRLLGVGQARIAEIESNPGAVSVEQLLKVVSALRASLVLRDEVLDVTTGRPDAVASSPSAPVSKPRKPPRQANPDAGVAPTSRRNFVIRPKKGSW